MIIEGLINGYFVVLGIVFLLLLLAVGWWMGND
jgi:hypothetical protein